MSYDLIKWPHLSTRFSQDLCVYKHTQQSIYESMTPDVVGRHM